MGGVALALAVILLLGAAGIYLVLRLLQNFQPGRKKIQADLRRLKADLQPLVSTLVPWSREEMEQLSLNQINRTAAKGMGQSSKGIYTTIYHEPVLAWSLRKYVGAKPNALLYARTTDHEFVYRMKNNEVELMVDNEMMGTVTEKGVLIGHKEKKQLAQINRDTEALMLPVQIGEKPVGSLVRPSKGSKKNPRAFQMLAGMDKKEESLFLSLAVLEMVRSQV